MNSWVAWGVFKGDKDKKKLHFGREQNITVKEMQILTLFFTLCNREFACYGPSVFISTLKLRKDLRNKQQPQIKKDIIAYIIKAT